MELYKVKNFLDKNVPDYKAEDVPLGVAGGRVMTKFWPYKLAGILIYGETAGIKRLPGRLILAPLSVLCRICPKKRELVREMLEDAVDLGLFAAVEFYSNHALITAAETPWELNLLDVENFGDGNELLAT